MVLFNWGSMKREGTKSAQNDKENRDNQGGNFTWLTR